MKNIILKLLSFKPLFQLNLKAYLPVTFSVIKSKSIIYRGDFFPKSLKICFAQKFFSKTFSLFPHLLIKKNLTSTNKTSYNTPMKKPMYIGRLFRQPCTTICHKFRFKKTYYSYLLYKGMSFYFYPLTPLNFHVYAFFTTTHSKGA